MLKKEDIFVILGDIKWWKYLEKILTQCKAKQSFKVISIFTTIQWNNISAPILASFFSLFQLEFHNYSLQLWSTLPSAFLFSWLFHLVIPALDEPNNSFFSSYVLGLLSPAGDYITVCLFPLKIWNKVLWKNSKGTLRLGTHGVRKHF